MRKGCEQFVVFCCDQTLADANSLVKRSIPSLLTDHRVSFPMLSFPLFLPPFAFLFCTGFSFFSPGHVQPTSKRNEKRSALVWNRRSIELETSDRTCSFSYVYLPRGLYMLQKQSISPSPSSVSRCKREIINCSVSSRFSLAFFVFLLSPISLSFLFSVAHPRETDI